MITEATINSYKTTTNLTHLWNKMVRRNFVSKLLIILPSCNNCIKAARADCKSHGSCQGRGEGWRNWTLTCLLRSSCFLSFLTVRDKYDRISPLFKSVGFSKCSISPRSAGQAVLPTPWGPDALLISPTPDRAPLDWLLKIGHAWKIALKMWKML